MSKTIAIKNGDKITLKDISLGDAYLRHEFFYKLTEAQKGMVHTVDEIEIHAQESQDQISDFLYNRRGLWLIAANAKGEIVAEVDITVKNLARVCHNGSLTIGVLAAYQGKGLGTAMMNEALLWARSKGLLRIEISVFKSNNPAIRLYHKFGFVQEGVRKQYFRILGAHDAFEDDILMAKYL